MNKVLLEKLRKIIKNVSCNSLKCVYQHQLEEWLEIDSDECSKFIRELVEENLIEEKYDFQCECGNDCTVYHRLLLTEDFQCSECERKYNKDDIKSKAEVLYEIDKQAVMDYKEEYTAINSQIRSFVEYKRNVRQDEIRQIDYEAIEVYEGLYHQEPFDVAFCPYRISPLGAHIDHQYGKINGLAIDKGIHMAYHPKQNGIIELQSLNFPKRAQFFVNAVPEEKQGDWADHLRGAAKMLGEKYRLKIGLSGVIEGSLPIGGLSSSASVIICFLSALCKVNDIHLEPMELILTAKAAENQYVGVSCGKLDQSCEVLSKKNHLLYLDTKDDSYELIPTSQSMKPYKIAIFFSGLERSLKNSKYNLRQDECKAAAYALMGYAGMDYGTFADTRLRDVPYEVFEAYKDHLPELWRRRAEHYYSEFARAEKGAELWREGDLEGYGQLVFESGKSSIYSYECGCDELKKLYEIMRNTDGIYGGRFSGAGFKGCCMALVDPEKVEDIKAKVTEEYLKAFPELEGRYSAYVCESADGVRL